ERAPGSILPHTREFGRMPHFGDTSSFGNSSCVFRAFCQPLRELAECSPRVAEWSPNEDSLMRRHLVPFLVISLLLIAVAPARSEEPRLVAQTGTQAVTAIALSADGKRVLTGSGDATACLWDGETGKELRTFRGHAGAVVAVAISADGKRLLTG